MNISELLCKDCYFVRGYNTRIIADDDNGTVLYMVLGKAKDDRYTIELYRGYVESDAVNSFLENEQ